MYDLLIKNARVVDGSGLPWFQGDVAVQGAKIAAVGKVTDSARRVIDADGRVVSPGFIDTHCHYDAQVTWDPLCSFSCYHGVTTVVIGNCSLALAPVRDGDEGFLAQTLARVEAIPLEVLEAGVPWSWRSTADYIDFLDRKLGVNVGVLVGHSAVRRYVMGEASQERDASGDELEQMKALVRQGMEAGALGLSVNRQAHFDLQGRPIPASVAPREELLALAATLSELGAGVMQCGGGTELEMADGLCSDLAEVSGRAVLYNSIRLNPSRPDYWREHLDQVEASAQRGLRAYPLLRTREGGSRFTMQNSQSFDRLATWKKIMRSSHEERLAAFGDAALRQTLREEVIDAIGKPGGSFTRRWENTFVTNAATEKNRALDGMSIEQIAAAQGKDPLDAFLDLAVEEDLGTGFERMVLMDEEAMSAMLNSPYPVLGISDGGAHTAFSANYGYGTYFPIALGAREPGDVSRKSGRQAYLGPRGADRCRRPRHGAPWVRGRPGDLRSRHHRPTADHRRA